MLSLRWILTSSLLFSASLAFSEPWEVHQRNIRAYEKKISEHQAAIEGAIARKKVASGADQMQEVTKTMVEEHSKLGEQITKRDKEIQHMRFRHPERGQDFERKYYKTYRFKTLAQFEEENSFEGRITRLHEKIKTQYGFKSDDEAENDRRTSSRDGDVQKSILLSK